MSSNNLNFWRRNWILWILITVEPWINHPTARNPVTNCHPQSLRDSVKRSCRSSKHFTTLSKRSMKCSMNHATTVVTLVFTLLKLFMSSDDLDWEYTISPAPCIHYCYLSGLSGLFVLWVVVTLLILASAIHQCYHRTIETQADTTHVLTCCLEALTAPEAFYKGNWVKYMSRTLSTWTRWPKMSTRVLISHSAMLPLRPQTPTLRPTHTDVNVRSIMVLMAQPQPGDARIIRADWINQPKIWLERFLPLKKCYKGWFICSMNIE